MEDYQAGRKGPANPMAAGTASLFGTATATSSATTGLFGSTAANTGFPFGQNKTNFGTPGLKKKIYLSIHIYINLVEISCHSSTGSCSVCITSVCHVSLPQRPLVVLAQAQVVCLVSQPSRKAPACSSLLVSLPQHKVLGLPSVTPTPWVRPTPTA